MIERPVLSMAMLRAEIWNLWGRFLTGLFLVPLANTLLLQTVGNT